MKLGILQCGYVQSDLAPLHGQYPDMFIKLLKQTDPSFYFTHYDIQQLEIPSAIDSCDTYLITGSAHSVNDDLPWLGPFEDFIRKLHAAHKKVIGICFGHQLIAKALGGKVIKSPHGWGIGMSTNKIIQQKSWMKPFCDQFNLLVSHQDQVVELPYGTELLASNPHCPIYMMQIGSNLCIQGHPEFSKTYSQALMESRQNMLDPMCLEQGLQSLQLNPDDHLIGEWIIHFLKT